MDSFLTGSHRVRQTPGAMIRHLSRRALPILILAAAVQCLSCAEPVPGERDPAAATSAYFERARQNPERLREFLSSMPLGGELHHHIGGAAPPGMLIGFAAQDGLCLPMDPAVVWRLTAPPCIAGQRRVAAALEDAELHAEIERRWSMRDFEPNAPGVSRTEANDFFFEIFPKIRLANRDLGRLLAGVRSLAAAQGIIYLETSSGWVPDPAARAELYALAWDDDLLAMRSALLADPRFLKVRDDTVAQLAEQVARSETLLGCGGDDADPGCGVEVRFQRIAIRTQVPVAVFVQTLLAYEVAQASPLVVAVNLVAPETAERSLEDYALHMRMYGELAAFYPGVRRSLHAGEMTVEQAIELGAREHLSLVIAPVETGGAAAHRVGHAVALDATASPRNVLAQMRARGVAVEINLRSNALLLGVTGEAHPLVDYLAAGVPVVLSTDDPGLMETDLREQFALAAQFEEVDYGDLKSLARNSLLHSFLPSNDKQRLLARLEKDLVAFESSWVD